MISYDDFEGLVREEMDLLPEYVFQDLSGGVLIDPGVYLHPARVKDDLYILGTYSYGSYMGKQIILYYGSFMATMGSASIEQIREQVRAALRHEFLHHMETRAGQFKKGTLIEEDRERMMRYFMRHREDMEKTEQKN